PSAVDNFTTLKFNFHWDRHFALSYVNSFQKWYPLLSLLTVHPLIFYILLHKSGTYGTDIKWGYVVNQICLLVHEFNFSFLFRMVNLIPYAGLYCGGPLCRTGLPHWMLMKLFQIPLSFTVIAVIPPFQFLLFRMHEMIVSNTQSKIRFSNRTQAVIMLAQCVLLSMNVFGFAHFGKDSDDSEELLQRSELAWLTHRSGTIFLFGSPGNPEYFIYEVHILTLSITLITPFVCLLAIHSALMIRQQVHHNRTSSRTQTMKNTVVAVFFTQIIGILIFYVSPLVILLLTMVFDFSFLPASILAYCRFANMPLFLCEPMMLSLIFLFRSPTRKVNRLIF
ncbi:hypothetical protein PFISCL1PPCAC_26144, partial [Pristionchus fissidentatus]